MQLFRYSNKANLEKLLNLSYDLLVLSVQKEPKKGRYYIQDNSNLDKLHNYFLAIIEEDQFNSDLIDIVKLVTFHQSLPNVKGNHSHSSILSHKQIQMLFDIRLIELMRVIMCNDSLSHSLFTPPYLVEEINENVTKVKNDLLINTIIK